MRKLLRVVLVFACVLMIGGCGKGSKTEYDMDEFSGILNELTADWEDDFNYLTDDEKSEQRIEIYDKYLKKFGLKSGQEITIRGYYNDYPNSNIFILRAEDDTNYESIMIGQFKEDGVKELLKEDEVIKVKGILFAGGSGLLDECELISPDISKREKVK